MHPFIDAMLPPRPAVRVEHIQTLEAKIEELTSLVRALHEREADKPDVDPKARYALDFAAAYLGTSTYTLRRRAAIGKLVVLHDGKKPFVTGAELLRYAREGGQRRTKRRRKATTA